jgi:hypothetical protein
MTPAVAQVLEFTLADAIDSSLFAQRADASPACVWCGSRRVTVSGRTGEVESIERDDVIIVCHECGSELHSGRARTTRDRRP